MRQSRKENRGKEKCPGTKFVQTRNTERRKCGCVGYHGGTGGTGRGLSARCCWLDVVRALNDRRETESEWITTDGGYAGHACI